MWEKWQFHVELLLWKQENPWLFDVQRRKKTEDGEILFFKALANRFWLTSKVVHGSTKLLIANLLSNGLHEKVIICYSK